jgi:hypothetical protein
MESRQIPLLDVITMHELPTPPTDEPSGDSQAHRLEQRRARLKSQIAARRAQLSGWESDWQSRWSELERLSSEPAINRTIVASELQDDTFASQALERLEQLQSQIAEEHEQIALLRSDFSGIGSRVAEQPGGNSADLEDRLNQIFASHSASLDQREKALAEREQFLASEREEIAALRVEVEAAAREAAAKQTLCDTIKGDWETALQAVAADRERIADEEAALAAERKALESARAALQKAQHEFELQKARTADSEESQQQSQIHDLTKQLEAAQAEGTSRREELARVWDELAGAHARAEESLKAERQMAAEAHASAARLEAMFTDATDDFRQRIEQQLEDHQRALLARDEHWQPQVDSYVAQVAELKQQCEELENALLLAHEEAVQTAASSECKDQLFAAQSDETRGQLLKELESLQGENTALRTRLEQAERAGVAAAAQATDRKEMDELRRRFELAVQDVRELKQKNSELTTELNKAKASSGSKPAAAGDSGKLDWEARKRQLLEQLEAEGEPEDSKRKTERLSIENTIRITDEVIAEKDRSLAEKESEIAELQRVLEDQSNNLGGVAVGAAAISQMFDKDSLVVQERERLQELQELVKQNEIALSMERAKVARIQQEFEGKLSELESQTKRKPEEPSDKKKASGNWMARLGLGDNKG